LTNLYIFSDELCAVASRYRSGKVAAALVAVSLLAGCASPGFMQDRRRDAADIFGASIGAGVGLKARLGPVGTGLLLDAPIAGLRGGDWLTAANFANPGKPVPVNNDIQLLLVGEEEFVGNRLVQERGKSFAAGMIFGLNIPTPKDLHKQATIVDRELRQGVPESMRYSPLPYLTQVEAVVGLGVSLRLGFNPGELVDFLLGWVYLDIFRDDIRDRIDSHNRD